MKYIVNITLAVILLILLFCNFNIRYGGERWRSCIESSDGHGYYAYLPATFIYKDLNFKFFDQTPYAGTTQDFRVSTQNGVIDKYFCGTAVAQTPFFLAGHLVTKLSGEAQDGYTKYYYISVSIAALFYLMATLYLLAKLLRLYQFSETTIAFTLAIFTFGTNVFYYIIGEPSMSHIYSLFFTTAFILYSKRWFLKPSKIDILVIGATLGMIILIRPVNGIIVFSLPFLAGSWLTFTQNLKRLIYEWKYTLGAFLLFLGIIFIQLIIYKIQTKSFIVDAYGKERFFWTNPQIMNVLFSYRKGLFLYTPITFISLIGLITLYRISKFQAFALTIFLSLVIDVLSSWWCWWYGGSFGNRAFIEFYPFFILLFGYAYNLLQQKVWRISFGVMAFLLLVVCQIQTYQYRYYYIHWGETSKEQYWKVFLRIDWAIQGTHKQPTDIPLPPNENAID